jgi:hypothetical protein
VLEVDLKSFGAGAIKLPHLHSLAIKSCSIPSWAVKFLQNVKMPVLRNLTLCRALRNLRGVECLIHELVKLTDPENSADPLELNELHLINVEIDHLDSDVLRRLYTQMSTVETLTLGPGNRGDNLALATELLPTSRGLPDLPLPRLRSLVVFDIPEQLLRRIVLERQSLARPLEVLHCCSNEGDMACEGNDQQYQPKNCNRISSLKSGHYTDVVARQWTVLMISCRG